MRVACVLPCLLVPALLSACHGAPGDDGSSVFPPGHAASMHFPDVAKGPITTAEIQYFLAPMRAGKQRPLTDTQAACALKTSQSMAQQAGDPDAAKPAAVAFLTARKWAGLGHVGKRLILTQVIVTSAAQRCIFHRLQKSPGA